MNCRRALAVLLLSFIQAAPAVAHDTWLLPARHAVPAGTTVVLDLTSGMAFPAPETAIKPDRIARAACRLAGKTFDIAGRSAGPRSVSSPGWPIPESPFCGSSWRPSPLS